MDEAASGAAGGGGDDGAVAILKKRTDSWPRVNASEAARYTCCRIKKNDGHIPTSSEVVSEYLPGRHHFFSLKHDRAVPERGGAAL